MRGEEEKLVWLWPPQLLLMVMMMEENELNGREHRAGLYMLCWQSNKVVVVVVVVLWSGMFE